jgi:hypothetical protein
MIAEMDPTAFNTFDGPLMCTTKAGYCPEVQDFPENTYYHGYWIDSGWFMRCEKEFRREFTFPPIKDYVNQKLLYDILNGNSLSVHVRRGDYVTLGYSTECDVYRACVDKALDNLHDDYTLYVFSDDIKWCKYNEQSLGFDRFKKIVYVEGNTNGNNYIDLQLMSNCKAMIISNSSFCFFAALLNTHISYYINTTPRKIR